MWMPHTHPARRGRRHRERRIVSWGEGARPRAIGAPQTARQDETIRDEGEVTPISNLFMHAFLQATPTPKHTHSHTHTCTHTHIGTCINYAWVLVAWMGG